jgi:hypothetical protein
VLAGRALSVLAYFAKTSMMQKKFKHQQHLEVVQYILDVNVVLHESQTEPAQFLDVVKMSGFVQTNAICFFQFHFIRVEEFPQLAKLCDAQSFDLDALGLTLNESVLGEGGFKHL